MEEILRLEKLSIMDTLKLQNYFSLLVLFFIHLQVNNVLIDVLMMNALIEKNISPLHLAVFKGHVDCSALLIEHGAEVDMRDESGMTPLFFAAVNGHKVNLKMN
jgi:ankyrin repeat protein